VDAGAHCRLKEFKKFAQVNLLYAKVVGEYWWNWKHWIENKISR